MGASVRYTGRIRAPKLQVSNLIPTRCPYISTALVTALKFLGTD